MIEYIIYCDESIKKGKYYSHFYGGSLVRSNDEHSVLLALNQRKNELFGQSEIKWSKMSHQYLEKYIAIMDLFFNFIKQDKIKMRVMFTQNAWQPVGLSKEQYENEYFILYYHFLKFAFGLQYSNDSGNPIRLRLYFDQFPDKKEKVRRFKNFITNLQNSEDFKSANIKIRDEDIAEIDSKKHVILQCCDIVTGAMQFRLNDLHKEIPEGATRRAKKTVAKEKLYKYINSRIRDIYPNFNIGDSTGKKTWDCLWEHPYRHWNFTSTNSVYDKTKCKPK